MATEESNEGTQIYIGGIAKKTKKEDLEKHFAEFGATLELYKAFAKAPYAFVKVADDKVEEITGKEHELNGAKLEVNVAREKFETIRYFLDSRMTKGALSELSEDQVKEYFSQYGEVHKLDILEGKNIGFLEMKKEEGNTEADGLAWKKHEIEGHEIDVKEQEQRRKRKRRGRGRGRGRRGRGRKRFKKNN